MSFAIMMQPTSVQLAEMCHVMPPRPRRRTVRQDIQNLATEKALIWAERHNLLPLQVLDAQKSILMNLILER